jgi:GNAT superfamily N-acetyltransferase
LFIEEYKDEHKKDVFKLFEKVFGKKMTDEYWDWRYNNEEFGKPIRYLMWDKQKLVGHYVVHPIPLKISQDIEKNLFSLSVMTDPNYRGKGIFPKLAKIIYENAGRLGYKLVIGFPNTKSYKIHFEKIDWVNFGNMIEFYKNIDSLISISNNTKITISQIYEFDERINQIWLKNKDNFKFLIPRTKEYLDWRFSKYPKFQFENYPQTEYFKFLIENNSEPTAYFIFKKFGKDIGHIVDFFGDLNQNIFKKMVEFVINFSYDKKINQLSCWIPFKLKDDVNLIFNQLGFQQKSSETYFGIHFLTKELDKDVIKKEKWFLTMSDSDVF